MLGDDHVPSLHLALYTADYDLCVSMYTCYTSKKTLNEQQRMKKQTNQKQQYLVSNEF